MSLCSKISDILHFFGCMIVCSSLLIICRWCLLLVSLLLFFPMCVLSSWWFQPLGYTLGKMASWTVSQPQTSYRLLFRVSKKTVQYMNLAGSRTLSGFTSIENAILSTNNYKFAGSSSLRDYKSEGLCHTFLTHRIHGTGICLYTCASGWWDPCR